MKKDKYIDRELSWLDFNARVLNEAMDLTNPLLERLKFMGIVSSNFDEFFMVRVASLQPPDPCYFQTYEKAFKIIQMQNHHFSNELIPALDKEGIKRILPHLLNTSQMEQIKKYFHNELKPLLTPIAFHEEFPVPLLKNLGLYKIVKLVKATNAKQHAYAVIEVPSQISRMITLISEQEYNFILLEDVISLFIREFFVGYEVVDQSIFRITRATELTLDEEKDEDFARIMTEALKTRTGNKIVRLEYSGSEDILQFIKEKMEIEDHTVCLIDSWFDLKNISKIVFQPTFSNLKNPPWKPVPVLEMEEKENIWSVLRKKDIVLSLPYDSFDAFVNFISLAATDPDVLAIKQTLYRTTDTSLIVDALEKAAIEGKQVTVLIELKARFDEEINIGLAERLIKAGVSVLYGVAGLKTHAKTCLIVRREYDGIKKYVHLSTGNYNEKTAQLYSDLSIFSSNIDLANDVSSFFNVITGFSQPVGFLKIFISPYDLRLKLEKLIEREIMRVEEQRRGLIMIKINSLVDRSLIDSLYKASQAGVKIKLNVRGICCLRPGVKGLSENIEVVSIVDMFLEHSRIFYFYNGSDEEVFLSSADWMPRNLDKRLEIMFPVESKKIKKDIIKLLKLYFKDNVKSWKLLSSDQYQKKSIKNEKFRVQEFLCKQTLVNKKAQETKRLSDLKPQKPK